MKLNSFRLCWLLIIVIFCTGFLSCASKNFSVSRPATVPVDFFGISPDRSSLTREDFDLLDEFNASWIRTTIRWSSVEQGEGNWVFDSYDEYLEKAEAAGKKVIYILAFDNPWLYSDGREHRAFTEREIPYFLKYVEQVVSRYGTRVIYEIWNEPNVIFWNGTNEQFFALSAAAAKKIRETDPEVTILAGSTFRVDKKFTRGLFNSGAMEHVDGFSVHPYGISPQSTLRQYNILMGLLNEFNFHKPVWITEVGYFNGPRPAFNSKNHAGNIVKTLSSFAIRAGEIRNVIWYELMDWHNPDVFDNYFNPLSQMGLIYPNGSFKPGAEAYMLTAGYLAGTEHRPELPARTGVNKKITSLYFIREDGTSILILWNNGIGRQNLYLRVPGAGNILRHNIHNREITSLSGEQVLAVGSEPIFITWNGGEPPLLTNRR